MSEKMSSVMQCSVGCDPELFIENKEGKIVGAERAIPNGKMNSGYVCYEGKSSIVVDGVAVELNPHASTCRAGVATDVKASLLTLERTLKEKGFKVTSDEIIKVDPEEFQSLSEKNRMLGCMPSFNAYDKDAEVKILKGTRYQRAAGGHIHLGAYQKPEILVPILDLFCGNTCVLLDRDPNQAIRRKQYGRAGEYRTPTHGFEYRTPSNFWLRAPQLMGFVMQLCRMAMTVSGYATGGKATFEDQYKKWGHPPFAPGVKWLNANVDSRQVQDAINENDFDLAMKNWKVFREFITKFVPEENNPEGNFGTWPLSPKLLPDFEFFVEKGIDHWWPKKYIVDNWREMPDLHGNNWEAWFWNTVHPAFTKQATKKVQRNEKLS